MASDETKLNKGYFHSSSKLLTEDTQEVFESQYSSNHINLSSDILINDIPHFDTESEVDTWITNNPDVLKKYTQFSLTMVPGSNFQSWYINDLGWKKRIITGQLAPEDGTNAYANGYEPKLYDSSNNIIPPSDFWTIDNYQGVIHFEKGKTPNDLGYGTPKITCFTYIGNTLKDYIDTTSTIYTSENDETILQGQLIYVKNNGHVGLANASSVSTVATGFAIEDKVASMSIRWISDGKIELSDWTNVTGSLSLTPGSIYFLDTINGRMTNTATSSGINVKLGKAITSTMFDLEISQPIRL